MLTIVQSLSGCVVGGGGGYEVMFFTARRKWQEEREVKGLLPSSSLASHQ